MGKCLQKLVLSREKTSFVSFAFSSPFCFPHVHSFCRLRHCLAGFQPMQFTGSVKTHATSVTSKLCFAFCSRIEDKMLGNVLVIFSLKLLSSPTMIPKIGYSSTNRYARNPTGIPLNYPP